jgi:hypothetical protein
MDIIAYQDQRDKELATFGREYTNLKELYESALASAIAEQDPVAQVNEIKRVLQLNGELASLFRAFIAKHGDTQGYNPVILRQISDDLAKYQNQYDEIQKSSDRVTTMKKIRDEDKEKLQGLKQEYNIYLGLILIAILIVLFLIFRTPSQSIISSISGLWSSPVPQV